MFKEEKVIDCTGVLSYMQMRAMLIGYLLRQKHKTDLLHTSYCCDRMKSCLASVNILLIWLLKLSRRCLIHRLNMMPLQQSQPQPPLRFQKAKLLSVILRPTDISWISARLLSLCSTFIEYHDENQHELMFSFLERKCIRSWRYKGLT